VKHWENDDYAQAFCHVLGGFVSHREEKPRRGRRKILIVLIDGFGPEYVQKSDMPNLKRLKREVRSNSDWTSSLPSRT